MYDVVLVYGEILGRIDEVSRVCVEIIRDREYDSKFVESVDCVEYYNINDGEIDEEGCGIIGSEGFFGIDEEISIDRIIDGNYV